MSLSSPRAPAAGSTPDLSLSTKLLYAVGATGSALKLRALSTFLLIFYNQVVGLPPATVGAILMVALVFDAILDPIVGQLSDNFRSRWGRRHPFMLAAALPFALSFFLLWNPPQGLSDQATAAYLAAVLLSLRFFDTFFELPHQALAPELAKDYDKRTGLLAFRQLFLVIGGLGMSVLAYQVFLKEQPDGTGGVLGREGYFNYALAGALIIFCTILLSTLGTLKQIPYLAAAPTRRITLGVMVREVAQTLSNRAFLVATLAGMFIAVAIGARNGLEIYFGLYFWDLTQAQLATLATVSVVGSVAGVAISAPVARVLGKKWGAITVFGTAVLIHVTPVSLRLLGLAPDNGTPQLLALLYGEELFNAAFAAATGVLLASMVADVVEDAEVKTGRRSEGLLLSAGNLARKMVTGVGIFIATTVLTVIQFPEGAKKGAVDTEILTRMGLAYIPTVLTLYGIAIACLMAFNISKARHKQNLDHLRDAAALAARTAEGEEAGATPIGTPGSAPG